MKCWETLWFSKGLSLFSPLNVICWVILHKTMLETQNIGLYPSLYFFGGCHTPLKEWSWLVAGFATLVVSFNSPNVESHTAKYVW